MEHFKISGADEYVFYFFCLCLAIQLFYYLVFFSRLAFYKVIKEPVPSGRQVSVIICARNESENLKSYLHEVLAQEYPGCQVVVVNDCSWDQSEKILEEFADAYPDLKVISLKEQERYRHGKKFALSIGIKGAANPVLLLTDADCRPAGKEWVQRMTSRISGKIQIVIGYGAYMKKPGWLNKWIRYDTFFSAMQYLSFALARIPYMGTGRNLCYTKDLFFSKKGFASHNHILSGDDDLFINEAANSVNSAVELHPGSFTYSVPETSFSRWFRQKKRHASTSKYYRLKHRLLLAVFFISHIFFYLSLVVLILLKCKFQLLLIIYAVRLVVLLLVQGLGMKKLNEPGLLVFVPLFDLFVVFIYPILAISNMFIKVKAWK